MQITTHSPQYYNLRASGSSSPAASEEPKESFSERARDVIGHGLINTANNWDLAIGGAAGIAVGTATVYASVLGGAILGAAIGGGLGPMVAAATSNGVLGFLGAAWTTTAIGAKVGMVVGAGTGLAGGWALGTAAASVPAKAIRWAGKKISGEDPDSGEPGGKPRDQIKMTGPLRVIGSVVAGAGALSGAIGGLAWGGGIGAASSTVTGLLSGSLTFGGVVAAAGTGALVGGGLMLIAGGIGGYLAVKGIQKGLSAMVNAAQDSRKWIELDEKENRLTHATNRLETLERELAGAREDAVHNHFERKTGMDNRETQLAEQNRRIHDKNARVDELVEKRAQQLYDTTKQGLIEREAGQDRRQTHLESEERRINQKYADIDKHIDDRQNALYDALEKKLEGAYQQRKGTLEGFERELDRREAAIPQTVAEKVERELAPMRENLQRIYQSTRDAESRADRLRSQAATDLAMIPGIQSQARVERENANQAEREADRLRPEKNSLDSQVSQRRSEVNRRSMELAQREQRVIECERNKRN